MTISKPKSLLSERDSMTYIDHVAKQWSEIRKYTAFKMNRDKTRLIQPRVGHETLIELL